MFQMLMKKVYLFTVLAILTFSAVTTQAHAQKGNWHFPANESNARSVFLYTLTTLSEPYTDLTGSTSINNGEVWDDPEYVVPIGFTFELNGNTVTALQFFGSGSLLAAETNDPDILTAVFPFEMDLIDRGANNGTSVSPLSYKVEGSAGSRICKIEWKNAGSFEELNEANSLDMFINFQLWLYEGSNSIEFHFGSNNINDPDLFYGGFGSYLGLTDLDQNTDELFNPHFFAGSIDMPFLIAEAEPIEGTPSSGTVYRLSLDLPVEVTVTGQNSTSTCDPNGSATAEATGGIAPYMYLWSNSETTQTISFLDAGTYSVTVTDNNGTTDVDSVTITNVGPINPNASATDETFVDGNDGTATSSAFGGSPPYSFEWSNGGTTQTISNLAPGLYTVTVTDSEDCFALQSVIVGAFGCPEIIIDADILNATCFGACDGEIDIAVTGGTVPYIYIWSNGLSSEDALGLCAGDYIVTVLDADGCTMSGGPYTVSQSPEIVVNAGATDETAAGANDGTAWAAPTGGLPPYTYSWSNGGTDSLILNLPEGVYTVIVTDAQQCATIETVTVNAFTCQLVSLLTQNNCFGNCDGIIEVNLINAVDPITYVWADGNTLPYIDSLCAGSYTVTAVDGAGCIATGEYTITQPSEILVNAGSTAETSPGANDGSAWVAPIGGTPPYTYNWSNGSSDSLIINLTPGTYSVSLTDAAGCEIIESISVEPFSCQGILETAYVDPSCYTGCDGSASIALVGGVGPITYAWNTGDTTNNILLLCGGTYEVTITDIGQNCVANFQFILTEPDSLYISVDQIVHVTDSTQGSIFITPIGGTSDYAFIWLDAFGNVLTTNEDLEGVGPGIYYPGVIDVNGCSFFLDGVEVLDNTVGTITLINSSVRLFPNPANEQVHIEIDDITDFSILLRGLDGRVIRSWKEETTIDVSSIPAGIYIVEGFSGSKMFRQRLVIAR
jgi:hypothetical protein